MTTERRDILVIGLGAMGAAIGEAVALIAMSAETPKVLLPIALRARHS